MVGNFSDGAFGCLPCKYYVHTNNCLEKCLANSNTKQNSDKPDQDNSGTLPK